MDVHRQPGQTVSLLWQAVIVAAGASLLGCSGRDPGVGAACAARASNRDATAPDLMTVSGANDLSDSVRETMTKRLARWRTAPHDLSESKIMSVNATVRRLRSRGIDGLAAHVTVFGSQRVGGPGGPVMSYRKMAVDLFDPEGNLVESAGGDMAADGINSGGEARLTTLGSDDAWFVWVKYHLPSDGFEQLSEIYLIGERLAPAMRVYHADFAYSDTREQTVNEGSHIWFNGSGHGGKKLAYGEAGTAADGKPARPEIVWDRKAGVFRGPRQISADGRKLYRVDLEWSHRFQPTDDPRPDNGATEQEREN